MTRAELAGLAERTYWHPHGSETHLYDDWEAFWYEGHSNQGGDAKLVVLCDPEFGDRTLGLCHHTETAQELVEAYNKAKHFQPLLALALAQAEEIEALKRERDEEKAKREVLLYWLLRAHKSGHREGWQEGPSVQETMDGIHSLLCNLGYDPCTPEGFNGESMGDMYVECFEEATPNEAERCRPDLYLVSALAGEKP